MRTARSGSATFTFPRDIGVGFASRDSYSDAAGHAYRSIEAGLLRGNWTITVGLQMPGKGRSALVDTVALVQQMIGTLHLAPSPTRPYPHPLRPPSPTDRPLLPPPAPRRSFDASREAGELCRYGVCWLIPSPRRHR